MISFTIIGLLLSIGCFCGLAQKANGDNCLIDENKVWEYLTDDRDGDYQTFTFVKYKFSGTEDKFGKTYNRWFVLESKTYINENVSDERSEWTIYNASLNELVALLREEDGKVYMLLDRDEVYEYDKDFNPFDKEGEGMGKTLRKVTPGEEVILYDFNVNAGGSYQGFIDDSILTPIKVIGSQEIENEGNRIKKISFVSAWSIYPFIQFHNVKYDTIEEVMPIYESVCEIPAVDGYGILYYGTLTDFMEPSTNDDNDCACWKWTCLNNVYDQSGKILFKGQNIEEPTSGIKEIGNNGKNNQIYDLFGLKVSNTLPGSIYIRDGKKFVGK